MSRQRVIVEAAVFSTVFLVSFGIDLGLDAGQRVRLASVAAGLVVAVVLTLERRLSLYSGYLYAYLSFACIGPWFGSYTAAVETESLEAAVLVLHSSHLIATVASRRFRATVLSRSLKTRPSHVASMIVGFGALAFAQIPRLPNEIYFPLSWVAVLVVVASVSYGRVVWKTAVLSLVACGLYAFLAFEGEGRLRLAAIGIAVAMTLSEGRVQWLHRLLPLMLVPGLLFAGSVRNEAASYREIARDGAGLGSVSSPALDLGRLMVLEGNGVHELRYGRSALVAAIALVPREVFSSKPDGLGAEAVATVRPEDDVEGMSIALTMHGEFVWNFGRWTALLGSPFVLLFTYGLVRFVTKRQSEFTSRISTAVLVASIPELYWAGLFTWMTRAGLRLFWVVVLIRLLEILMSHRSSYQKRVAADGSSESNIGRVLTL